MLKSGTPEKTTISPAAASSTARLPSLSCTKSSEILTCCVALPGPEESPIGWPLRTEPARIRPMPSRPMKGSEPMLEIWSCSGKSKFALGLGKS